MESATPYWQVHQAAPKVPLALRPGDRIGVVAPAGPVDPQRLEAGLTDIRRRGFEVLLGEHLYRRSSLFAGSDGERASDLLQMLHDPTVKAVFCARGGYGSQRLLPRLKESLHGTTPKVLVGYSDITALHSLLQQAGWITWHGPMPGDWVTLQDGGFSVETLFGALAGQLAGEVPVPDPAEPQAMQEGIARGRLVGGNLSLVTALLGSEYETSTEGAILFLEEVGEAPYRIDRMLSSLQLTGKLKQVTGVLLGQFTRCDPAPNTPGVSVEEVLRSHFLPLGVPVLWKYPAGHGPVNVPLPLGCRVELDATQRKVRLLSSPVRAGE